MLLNPYKKIIRLSILLFILILSRGYTAFAASWTSAGPIVGYIHSLAMSPSNPDVMYVAIPNRVVKTTDGGSEWNLLPGSPESEILEIKVDPNDPDVVYAGTKDGIYKSENGGETWLLKGLSGAQVNTIAIDPLNALIIYAGTGRIYYSDIKDIFKSINGGNHWEPILQERMDAVAALLIDPDDSLSIYAGIVEVVHSYSTFLKSIDGGIEWLPPPFPYTLPQSRAITALAMTPAGSSPPVIYALLPEFGVYKSIDRGEHWELTGWTNSSYNIGYGRLAVDPNDSNVVYLGVSNDQCPLYKSTNDGDDWSCKSNGLPSAPIRSIVIDPRNSNVFVGLERGGVYMSTNGAESWDLSFQGLLDAYINDLAVHPAFSGSVFAVVDGDNHLAKTTNGGSSWNFLSDSPTYLGTVAIDPLVPSTVWVGDGWQRKNNFYIYKNEEGGENWEPYTSYVLENADYSDFVDILIHPYDSNSLLVGTSDRYDSSGGLVGYNLLSRTNTGGTSWLLYDDLWFGGTSAMAMDPNNPNILYSARIGVNAVFKRTNVWWDLAASEDQDITPAEGIGEVKDIVIDWNSKAYFATDGGLMKWDNPGWTMLTGLPTDDITALAFDRSTWPGIVYAGTGGYGVYVSEDGGSTWTPFNEGLENLSITKLAVSETKPKMLYAGTANGGVWSTRIPDYPYYYPPTVLWNQPLRYPSVSIMPCQDFEETYDAYDIFTADDFSTTQTWKIKTVFIPGYLWGSGTTLMNATALHFQIYADDQGTPDGDPYGGGNSPVWNLSVLPTDSQITISDGIDGLKSNVTLNLDTPIILQPGTYWFSFYPELLETNGHYGKLTGNTANGNPAQVINPGGGFAFPPSWTSVTDASTWNFVEQDFAFLLAGSIGDWQGDSDDDGILDGNEDKNHDGIIDTAAGETDPYNPDTDDDGLLDGEEVNSYNTNPLIADSDQDGTIDGDEVAAGSDPANINSYVENMVISLQPGFNILPIPAEVMFMPDLRDWLPIIGNSTEIEKVMVHDEDTNQMIVLIPGDPGNPSFILSGGEALIVYANEAKDVEFLTVLCADADLYQGMNLIVIACPPAGYTAGDLLTDLTPLNITSIQRYNTNTGIFETLGFDADDTIVGHNFPIVPGEGYLIHMKQAVSDFRISGSGLTFEYSSL